MDVAVDAAGGDDAAARVGLFFALGEVVADGGNFAVFDADVGYISI